MPKINSKGYFAWKDSMKVTAANITTGWYAGMLFTVSAGSGDDLSHDEVGLQTSAGGIVYGLALDNSSEAVTTNVAGMNPPSASKVTLLHGHSKFEINHKAEVLAGSSVRCYEPDVALATVGALLYCSSNGKLTIAKAVVSGSIEPRLQITAGPTLIIPVGFVTKVPILANNWTLGLVLFG